MGFLAWRRADAIGRCLDAGLAILAALGAQASTRPARPRRPRWRALVDEIRDGFPPVDEVRPLGPDGDALTAAFGRLVFAGPVAAAGVGGSGSGGVPLMTRAVRREGE